MMVSGLQQNMKKSCVKHPKHGINGIGIEKLVKQPFGRKKSMSAVWRNGRHKSKVEASQTIQLFHMDHLPKETSSMRVPPNVHEALQQNDPSRAPGSQPVLKKAPPSAGRPRPEAFYTESEPPRIGTAPVQASTTTQASEYVGGPASRYVSFIDSYSHDSRQSTSSTYRGTSKANADRDESGDTQASIAPTSSTGSA